MNKNKKVIIVVLSVVVLLGMLIILIGLRKNIRRIELEYQEFDKKVESYGEGASSGNIVFTKEKIENQVMLLNDLDEYKKYTEKYVDKLEVRWLDREGNDKNIENAKERYDANEVALIVYYDKMKGILSDSYYNDTVLYWVLENDELLFEDLYKNGEIDEFNSIARLFFINKEDAEALSKVVVMQKD